MKKLLALILTLVFALSLTAVAEQDVIVIGATPSPHAEVLNFIAEDMAELGYPIEVKIFNDYNLPCPAVASGELDANYFAHIPFINGYNASVSEAEQVTPVIGVHYEPFGIYSNKIESLEELPENATVCIPNDVSNQTRALFLLQDAGLIVLPEDAEPTDELNITDIVEIKNGLQISDIDAAQLPSTLEDKDIVVINGNFALDAGLSPLNDAIFYEPAEGDAAAIYANYVVVAPANTEAEWVKALESCLCSEKVYEFMTDNEAYAGGVIPFFSIDAE
ncbi:MAG: metal ABC transporter substrate-binding protein [Clostridia bacterium]|nr:metal ABC transporter substrate-binding protein [Clostridia bacterium]